MKKFMVFVMIATIGMFCSLGCTQQPAKKKTDPKKVDAPVKEDEKPAVDKPAEPGDKPAADMPAEPAPEEPAEPAPEKPVD